MNEIKKHHIFVGIEYDGEGGEHNYSFSADDFGQIKNIFKSGEIYEDHKDTVVKEKYAKRGYHGIEITLYVMGITADGGLEYTHRLSYYPDVETAFDSAEWEMVANE